MGEIFQTKPTKIMKFRFGCIGPSDLIYLRPRVKALKHTHDPKINISSFHFIFWLRNICGVTYIGEILFLETM